MGEVIDVFNVHKDIIDDYKCFVNSFISIKDDTIRATVESEMNKGKFWPEPLIQFNPSFEYGTSIQTLCDKILLHPELANIFKGFSLFRHQVEAITKGSEGLDYVVTSGTGSGKSLIFLASIFDYLLKNKHGNGIRAVIVYPMNALINSQHEEFTRYKNNYKDSTGKEFPITFGQYTGQEGEDARAKMQANPPQILLTNYMMLELLLTRFRERSIRDGIYENLRFLVFDELHTYRGRQGADVAMLIRRIRANCAQHVINIGTSATMVSDAAGNLVDQRAEVAGVATKLFGRTFAPGQVVNEKLTPSLSSDGLIPPKNKLADAIAAGINHDDDIEKLKGHPGQGEQRVRIFHSQGFQHGSGQGRRRKRTNLAGCNCSI